MMFNFSLLLIVLYSTEALRLPKSFESTNEENKTKKHKKDDNTEMLVASAANNKSPRIYCWMWVAPPELTLEEEMLQLLIHIVTLMY